MVSDRAKLYNLQRPIPFLEVYFLIRIFDV